MGILDSLIQNESGGRWDARNNAVGAGGKVGHFGRLQFGQARLQDAINAGVAPKGMTPDQFMADPALQQKVEAWHFADIDAQAGKMGLNRFIGQNIGGVMVTPQAIRSMAHLGGIGGAAKFLQSGGKHNPADANGTSLSDYGQRHGGESAQVSSRGGDMQGNSKMQGGGGLLSMMGGAGGDTMQEEAPKSWADRTINNRDWRQRVALAMQGLVTNPNQPLIQMLGGEIQGRKDLAQEQQAQDRQRAQVNKTVEWLRANGQETLAQALETGAVDAGAVVNQAMQAMQPPSQMDQIELQKAQLELQQMQLPQAVDPSSTIGKLEADRRSGLITEDQYQAALSAMAPSQMTVYGPDGTPILTQGGKALTEAQSKDAVYATRAEGALATLDPIADQLINLPSRAAEYDPTGFARGAIQSPEFQVAQTAGGEFLQAILRKDTGAAITQQEQELYGKTFLPQMGDTAEVLRYKKEARRRALEAIKAGMPPSAIVGQELALQKSGSAILPNASANQVSPVTIQNDAEYDALPSGTEFVGPDGIKRRKP